MEEVPQRASRQRSAFRALASKPAVSSCLNNSLFAAAAEALQVILQPHTEWNDITYDQGFGEVELRRLRIVQRAHCDLMPCPTPGRCSIAECNQMKHRLCGLDGDEPMSID